MRASLDGINIEYEVTGSGPPLVFVAGTGVGGGIWHRAQVPSFKNRRTCITFDLRGAGESDAPPGPYTVAELARDTELLLDHLGITSAAFVGLSLGSAILQELALARPEMVDAMVLLSTWSSSPNEHHIRRWFEARLRTLEEATQPVFAGYSFWMWAPSFVDDEPEEMAEHGRFFAEISGSQPTHAYESHFRADIGHDTASRLPLITCPTMVLYGDEDLITLPRYNRRVAELVPNATSHEISGAGHMALLERPIEVNDAIARFLDSAGV